MGCVTQVGPQSTNIARTAVLAAGWPISVPGTTVDRQCGSSQQAIHFAAQSIMSGVNDVVVAAGIECMSTVPMFSNAPGGDIREVYGEVVQERFGDQESYGLRGLVPQGISAELICDRWQLSRTELDEYSLRSHQLAAAARDSGRFDSQIGPIQVRRRDRQTGAVIGRRHAGSPPTSASAPPRARPSAGLAPAFVPDGRITAGNSSQIVDGSAAVLLMSATKAAELGLRPRAAVRHMSVVGADPVEMLSAPIPATARVLARAGLTDLGHRPLRGQRGVRPGRAGLAARHQGRAWTGSTSTAAGSRSATRWALRAPS